MYLGEIVELADAEELYPAPAHHYTAALLSAIPQLEGDERPAREQIVLTGDVPSAANKPAGCAFHPRCPAATDLCRVERPALQELGDGSGRQVACHHPIALPTPMLRSR